MRLFIAINFNPDTKARLLALRDELRAYSKRGNFSAPENLHLTLAFLGECDGKQTAAARIALDTITFEPFYVKIDYGGRFRRDGGDIWWAGIHENAVLSKIQRELWEQLRKAGFAFESRRFSPHITLGREVASDYGFGKIEPFGETVASVELMKSERIAGKLTYTTIYRRYAQNAV